MQTETSDLPEPKHEPFTLDDAKQMLTLIARATGVSIEVWTNRNDQAAWLGLLARPLWRALEQYETDQETMYEQIEQLGIEPGPMEAKALGLR